MFNDKICPDFSSPCLKEDCISYIPSFIFCVEDSHFMKLLCNGLNVDFNLVNYPCFLDIKAGFCKKYSEQTDDCALVDEINRISEKLSNYSNKHINHLDTGEFYG